MRGRDGRTHITGLHPVGRVSRADLSDDGDGVADPDGLEGQAVAVGEDEGSVGYGAGEVGYVPGIARDEDGCGIGRGEYGGCEWFSIGYLAHAKGCYGQCVGAELGVDVGEAVHVGIPEVVEEDEIVVEDGIVGVQQECRVGGAGGADKNEAALGSQSRGAKENGCGGEEGQDGFCFWVLNGFHGAFFIYRGGSPTRGRLKFPRIRRWWVGRG